MRLWSLHPQYLDPQGLVAVWREGLLARAVLRGQTRGYRNHPQLARFKAHSAPRAAIDAYLLAIHDEASARGYQFDRSKIGRRRRVAPLAVTRGQLDYEWQHLRRKLRRRSRATWRKWADVNRPVSHPLLRPRQGGIATWEKVDGDDS